MNALFLALIIVAVIAAPLPEDVSGSIAVEMIVNSGLEGAALENSDMVGMKLNERTNHNEASAMDATNLLHTAVGIAEAVSNDVSVIDSAVARNVHPNPKVTLSIPIPNAPAIMIPGPIVKPPPVGHEKPEKLPVAARQYKGEMYNDGYVQRQYNGPQEPGMLSTLQSWFNSVIGYFSSPSSGQAVPDFKR